MKCSNGGHNAGRNPLHLCDGMVICRLCASHILEVYFGLK